MPPTSTPAAGHNGLKELRGTSWNYVKQILTFQGNGSATEIQKEKAILCEGYSWKVLWRSCDSS